MRLALTVLLGIAVSAIPGGQNSAAGVTPMQIVDGGYPVVVVRFNDEIDARMLVDTGAGINVVSAALFERLRPTLRPAGSHTGTRHTGETLTGPVYTVPSLTVAGRRLTDVVVGRYEALSKFDGLLSLDFFRDVPVTMDFRDGQLRIETATDLARIASTGTPIAIRVREIGRHEIDFFVRVCLPDNVEVDAYFDTGAGFNMLMLRPGDMARLGVIPPPVPRGGLEYYVHSTNLESLSYCGAPTLRQQNVFVGFREGLIYEGLIGAGMFRQQRLTIDLVRRRMIAW